MANLKVKDGDANPKYLKASGTGAENDPYIPEHLISGAVTGPVTNTELRASNLPVQLKDQYGFVTECTPLDELRVASSVRLVGSTFTGTTVDSNFWTATPTNSATITQANGEVVLASGVNAAGSAIFQSVRSARYVGGASNRYRAQIQFSDTGKEGNTKRWGLFDGTNGAYFKFAGIVAQVCTMRGGVETAVASTSWNGSTTLPTFSNCNTYEIYITNRKVYFVIAGTLMHTVDSVSQTWTATTTLPIRADNINSGNTTNTTMSIRVNTIYRLGELETLPTYKHITTAATTICKYGAGNLHRITVNDPGGTLVTIYDNLAGSGTVIGVINTPSSGANPLCLEYHLPFAIGLTIVSTGTWT